MYCFYFFFETKARAFSCNVSRNSCRSKIKFYFGNVTRNELHRVTPLKKIQLHATLEEKFHFKGSKLFFCVLKWFLTNPNVKVMSVFGRFHYFWKVLHIYSPKTNADELKYVTKQPKVTDKGEKGARPTRMLPFMYAMRPASRTGCEGGGGGGGWGIPSKNDGTNRQKVSKDTL